MKGMLRYFVALIIVIGISIPGFLPIATLDASESRLLNLEDCIAIALKNNPEIGIAEEGLQRAEKALLGDYGQLLPNFSLSFSTGHMFYGPSSIQYDAQGRPVQTEGFDYESYSFGMSSYITLYDGGRTINGIRASMKSRDAAREDFEYSKNLITARVIRAYYNLVRSKMLLTVAEESVENAGQNLKRSEALLEVGSATRADVLKASVLYSNTRYDMIKARNAADLAMEDLITLLSIRESRRVDVDTSMVIEFIEPELDREIQYALAHRPDLRSLDYSVKSAHAGISAAKSGWLPQIGARFSYGWSDREMVEDLNFFRNEYAWSIGASVSFDVFDRFLTSSNVGTAKANSRIAEYNLERAELDAIREIKGLVFTIKEAKEMIAVSTETVEQAAEDLRLAEERYRVGAGTMLETIDAQVALTRAKANVIDAKCNYLIAVADLSRATGRRIYR